MARVPVPSDNEGRLEWRMPETAQYSSWKRTRSSHAGWIRDGFGIELEVVDYVEHAIGHGSDVQAAAYVECRTTDGETVWGVGIDEDVATASVRAVLSAANRAG